MTYPKGFRVAMAVICLIFFVYCLVAIWTTDLPVGIAGGAAAGWLLLAKDWWGE
jgi:hypothetical protein